MANELIGRRVLWGVGTPRTMRSHWALHELSLQYETKAISPRTGETLTQHFSALNPRQKIPLLQDGDFTIAESPAIIAYLAERYCTGSDRLIPTEQRARARWLEWNFFIAMELDATCLYVIRRHEQLPDIYGEAPATVDSSKAYFLKQLIHVDQVLRSNGPFLMGKSFTTADILLTTCLTWATRLKIPLCDSCRTYIDLINCRPAYQLALTANARIT